MKQKTERSQARWLVGAVLVVTGCGVVEESEELGRTRDRSHLPGPVAVNECRSGSGSWVELINDSDGVVDLAADPDECWFVDDVAGGAQPKRITDTVVNHPAGSTTCADAGRPSKCGLVAPGERVWVDYGYVNATSADACRLVRSAWDGVGCGTEYLDDGLGGPTNSTVAGQCFGRSPDGGASWSATPIPCTPEGAPNPGTGCATEGQVCDDRNACTIGEVFDAACVCGGGTTVSCGDGNVCTADSCDMDTGCVNAPVTDGTTCPDGTCEAGLCRGAAPFVVINEFLPGRSGWVELHNPDDTVADLTGYVIDDVADAGSQPKAIVGGTTIAPGGFLVIGFGGINTTSSDQVRLVDAGALGGAGPGDATTNFWTKNSIADLCFGRSVDGGAWASAAVTCTQGLSNGACPEEGDACDDGDACTTGSTVQADCSCGGGTAVTCDDADACTADACDSTTGCEATPLPDGSFCGQGMECDAGACVAAQTGGPGVPAQVVSVGTPGKLLLRGTVVTPDVVFVGEVLVESNVITCAAPVCAYSPASPPSIVETNGIIFPGMIDTHNHILFDVFDEDDWSPTQAYQNHNQWPGNAKYGAVVDAKQHLNGEYGSTVSIGCELDKYGELKGLVSGTTSIVGSANPANKACYGSVARTIDQGSNDMGFDKVQASTLFPNASSADSICSNIAQDQTDAYVIHVGEGIDETSRAEFDTLFTRPTVDGCLHAPETTIVHGTAFGEPEFSLMGTRGMSLAWSPRSNVFLYGMSTDLSQTTNIPLALSHGINVALAPDWSLGGSQNLLDELRFANQVDDTEWNDILTPKELTEMVTVNAAAALGLEDHLGRIEAGFRADLFVIGGDSSAPYDALLAATPTDVRLVIVDGVPLYGDVPLEPVAPQSPGCEALSICGADKFVCIAEPGGTSTNRLGQTFAEIVAIIEGELTAYDDMNLTQWDFMPLSPIVKCQ